MRLRRPEPRRFPLSLGFLVGLAGFLATPRPWPTDPVLGVAVGACVGAVVWAALEQVPDALDRAVSERAYLLVGGLGLVAVAGVVAPSPFGGGAPSERTAVRALVFALGTLVVTSIGDAHHGMLLLKRESVAVRVTAVESRRHEVAFRIVGVLVGMTLLSLALEGSVSAGSVVGTVVGAVIASAFTGVTEYELVALDDYLLFHRGEGWGGTAVPWRRLRGVTVEDDTLRVARGLPYPTIYTADLSEVEDRRAVLEAFRSYPYLH